MKPVLPTDSSSALVLLRLPLFSPGLRHSVWFSVLISIPHHNHRDRQPPANCVSAFSCCWRYCTKSNFDTRVLLQYCYTILNRHFKPEDTVGSGILSRHTVEDLIWNVHWQLVPSGGWCLGGSALLWGGGLAGGGESLRNKYKELYPSPIQYLSLMVALPKCEEPQLTQQTAAPKTGGKINSSLPMLLFIRYLSAFYPVVMVAKIIRWLIDR